MQNSGIKRLSNPKLWNSNHYLHEIECIVGWDPAERTKKVILCSNDHATLLVNKGETN